MSVAILLVITVLAMPSLREYNARQQLERAGAELAADLRLLQNKALNGEVFNLAPDSIVPAEYTVTIQPTGYAMRFVLGPDVPFVPPEDLMITQPTWPGYSFDPVNCTISFAPYTAAATLSNCLAMTGSALTITVTAAAGERRQVVFDTAAGTSQLIDE